LNAPASPMSTSEGKGKRSAREKKRFREMKGPLS
jgi:hypothetical protein